MAKAIEKINLDTNLDTYVYTNVTISSNEIAHARVDTIGVLAGDQYRLKRICTNKDNDLKALMDAHLEERASHYT